MKGSAEQWLREIQKNRATALSFIFRKKLMDQDTAIDIIQDYILDLKIPKYPWKIEWFEEESIKKWAANEVLEYVRDHGEISPTLAIEEFIYAMDYYSCMNMNTSRIFSTAKIIGEDILDIFLCAQ